MNLREIEEKVKKELSSERYKHSIGVKELGTTLATIYGADVTEVEISALLHDYAKHFSDKKIESELLRLRIKLCEEDKNCLGIWHAILSAELLKSEFCINDSEIYNAIRIHPTGDVDMTLLEKIIVVSDYIEPYRKFNGIERLRKLASQDIDSALYLVLKNKIDYIRNQGEIIHPRGLRALKWIESVLVKSDKLKTSSADVSSVP